MKILSLGGGLLFCPHAIYRRSCGACDDAGSYDDARAGAAMMIDGKFTAKERSYLASLPAVKRQCVPYSLYLPIPCRMHVPLPCGGVACGYLP